MEVIIDQVSKSFRNGKKVLPVLGIERLDGFYLNVAEFSYLLHMKVAGNGHRVGGDGQLCLHRTNVVLAVVVHNVVGSNEGWHVTARFAR